MADDSPPSDSAEARRAALIRATLERRRSRDGRAAVEPKRGGGRAPVAKRTRTGPAPVSFAQERLWFLEQLGEAGSGYNIFLGLSLDGDLDAGSLAGALASVVRRHESLRTRFEERDGQPVQVIQPPAGRPLPRIDLRRVPAERRDGLLRRVTHRFRNQRLDLSRGPLFRAALADLGASRHALLLVVHHAVSDGWSTGILLQELTALYRARVTGEPADLPELGIQYADFAAWQREWLTGEVLEGQLAFWRDHLDGAPEELALPTDRPRPPVQTYRGAAVRFHWPPELRSSLTELARRERGSLFMVLLAGWAALLARYSGQPDLTVGTPIANRNRYELEPLIGLFANTLVLRADLRERPSFLEAVRRIRDAALGAFSHQELPFERLVAELQPRRSLSHSPLFQVFFALQNTGSGLPALPGVETDSLRFDGGAARFDLDLTLVDDERGIGGRLVHNRDLFDPSTARRMVEHLRGLFEAAVRRPDLPALELPLLAPSETHQLLREWSRTEAPRPEVAHLPAAFEAQV
ncbi:MAG: condensation domain-containing protein, partial [Acidobacteriota bacterium]